MVEIGVSPTSVWSYRIEAPSQTLAEHEIQPGKLLAIGSPQVLSSLLGLETHDPFMGLPAKWISSGQRNRAAALPLEALFDETALIATHLLQTLPEHWGKTVGLRELVDWMSSISPDHLGLLDTAFRPHQGLFLETLAELVSDSLWLPPVEEYLELFSRKLSQTSSQETGLLLELMRAEILPRNLHQFSDSNGSLHAVDWRGDPDEANYSLMFVRLDNALSRIDGPAVVITSVDNRLSLSRAVRQSFPEVSVLSWNEIPEGTEVSVESVVDATMEFDPSPWPQAVYFYEPGNK